MMSLLSLSLIFFVTLKAQFPAIPPPPQQTTSAPVIVTPSNPNINPVTPIVNPVNPFQPVTPQQPPATPQYGQPLPPQQGYPPYNQYNPYNQYGQQYNPYSSPFGGFIPGLIDHQNLNCEYGQCRNRRLTLSPQQGFQLNCQIAGECNGLDLTLNVGGISEINDLSFEAPQNGVTVRINGIGGNNVEVNNLRCSVFGACNNLKIIAGFGVEVYNMNVHCDQPGSCNRCTINGQPCMMFAMMNNNHPGYGSYGAGYGHMNQQNMPGQYGQYGQYGQPQYGQPQMPQYPGSNPQAPTYGAPQQTPPMPQQGSQYPQYPQFGAQYPQWV